jgi:phosphate transport system permease protein
MDRRRLRRLKSNVMVGLMAAAVVVAVLPLFLILASLVLRGAQSLTPEFFVNRPAPVGETGGGVAHAILGTLMIVGVASLVAVPVGIGAGIFAS